VVRADHQHMLKFLSNCCVSTALTKQPSAYYLEYLREFWYSAMVDAVPLISHRLKVVKLSTTKPEKTLLLSFGELNADSSTDQSLSAIDVQSATQSKAATSKKSKKMKITSSSKCLNASHFNFGGD
ncbi:hypothetical protein Tco_1486031, partial [Tanacetum coccineum]